MSGKVALIAGVAGQNGAYLAEFLLNRGYTVHAVKRRSAAPAAGRIDRHNPDRHLESGRYFLHYGDLTDAANLVRIVQDVRPEEIYNLGAESQLQVSGETPEYTAEVDALGTLRLLEAIRILEMQDRPRFYQSSTSELFGRTRQVPSETTPFCPSGPFAAAKLYAWWLTRTYREEYGLHASNGILFGHEGPLRGEAFVTRKITRAVAAIERGIQERLYLGNIDARRDWGHTRDYVAGMWMIVQQDIADDYVLATGETHTVREFVELAFAHIGRPVVWEGRGLAEVARCVRSGDIVVSVDPRHFRPRDADLPAGDASKARTRLGWRPCIGFEQIVAELVDADRLALEREMFENV